MLTLADHFTLARLGLAPTIVACYLLLPLDGTLCFWVVGWLCGFAEITDYVDGRIARARGEVSDFGKLADPFCDVFYRLSVFLVFLLPIGGIGYAVGAPGSPEVVSGAAADFQHIRQLVFVVGHDANGTPIAGAGLVPWLPVLLMVLREIVAGALRAMTATKGLVLAARASGKVKAWAQGVALITIMAWPALFWAPAPWHLDYAYWATWICAVLSLGSMAEYFWVNRQVVAQIAHGRSASTNGAPSQSDGAALIKARGRPTGP